MAISDDAKTFFNDFDVEMKAKYPESAKFCCSLLESMLSRASEDRLTAIEVCETIENHLGNGKSTSSTNEKEDMINDDDLDAI
jgi:hypothetical protein